MGRQRRSWRRRRRRRWRRRQQRRRYRQRQRRQQQHQQRRHQPRLRCVQQQHYSGTQPALATGREENTPLQLQAAVQQGPTTSTVHTIVQSVVTGTNSGLATRPKGKEPMAPLPIAPYPAISDASAAYDPSEMMSRSELAVQRAELSARGARECIGRRRQAAASPTSPTPKSPRDRGWSPSSPRAAKTGPS